MSTKIYDAYEYTGTIDELMTNLFAIREEYTGCVKTQIIDMLYRDKAYHGDFFLDGKLNRGKLRDEMKRQCTLIHPSWSDELAFVGCVTIYFCEGRTFFQAFGLEHDGMKLATYYKLLDRDDVADFHYQNQCDPDESVSEHDWNERERIWDVIFDVSRCPRTAGLQFEMIPPVEFTMLAYDVVPMWMDKEEPQPPADTRKEGE